MIKNISIGIDVGTRTTRVVVGEFLKGEKVPKILATGESDTRGMRHGYVINGDQVASSVRNAVNIAEKAANMRIKRAFLSLHGSSLRGEVSTGSAIVSKADGEVTNLDVNKAVEDAEDNLNLGNKKVIQVFPISFRLDAKDVQGRLEGMRGTKLEVRALFVTYSVQHLEDLLEAVALAGVEAVDVIPSPLAVAQIALTEKQKMVGVALVDIGAETTTLSVFENGRLISVYTFPIGSGDITNDIALGFKIPLEKAEGLKLGNVMDESFSRKKLDEFIAARLEDIFEYIENHLKKIKRSELLPAGVIFVGGGSMTPLLEELSRTMLKLPSGVGTTDIFGSIKTKLRDSTWFNVLGLLTVGEDAGGYSGGSLFNLFKDLKRTVKASIKQLMP